MDDVLDAIRGDLLNPKTLIEAAVWAFVFIGLAVPAAVIRKFARRVESG